MSSKFLYLGDTKLDQAARYLAGVMTNYNIRYDYYDSDTLFNDKWLENDYKGVIVSDYPASNFSQDQMSVIASKVNEGMGLVMIGGWDSFTGLTGGYNKTIFADVLPVVMSDEDDRVNCFGPCVVVKDAPHDIIQSLPFDSHAPLVGGFNAFRAKDDGLVVLSTKQYGVSCKAGKYNFTEGESNPLLVVGSFGKGRVAAFASDVAPHWIGPLVDWGDERLTAHAKGAGPIEVGNWYALFFLNLLRWTINE